MRRTITLLIPLSVVVFAFIGCYTVLKHPTTDESYTAHDYQNNCLSCHTDYHEYPYGYFYGHYPDYWWSTPRWGRYYAYPWWWDYYWYDGDRKYRDDDDLSPRPSEGEKAVRRDALRPPYTSPTSVIPSFQGTNPPASGGSSGTKPGTPGDPPQSKPSDDKQKDNPDSGKKAPRRGGRE
jgi:hypothetical protein